MTNIGPERETESVWDYPRPPRLEDCSRDIRVVAGGATIVESQRSKRVLETSHPPTYYIPPEDVMPGVLLPTDRRTLCEWKGVARYFHVFVNELCFEFAAWSYLDPTPEFLSIKGHIAFYAQLMDACYVDGERVQPQLGGFYGGWITREIRGVDS